MTDQNIALDMLVHLKSKKKAKKKDKKMAIFRPLHLVKANLINEIFFEH